MAKIIKHTSVFDEQLFQEPCVITISPSFTEEQISLLEKKANQQCYDQGQKEMQEQSNQERNELKNRLESLLKSIPNAIEQHRLGMQKELAPLIWQIVQGYFVEQSLDQQLLETQINRLLMQINKEEAIELYLHTRDIEALKDGNIQLNSLHKITIKQDESLDLGGFIIKTEHGLFNVSIYPFNMKVLVLSSENYH